MDCIDVVIPNRYVDIIMQIAIVIVVLCVTLFFVVRGVVKFSKGESSGCGCCCDNCPYKTDKHCQCKNMKKDDDN